MLLAPFLKETGPGSKGQSVAADTCRWPIRCPLAFTSDSRPELADSDGPWTYMGYGLS
jgi:hypothetical protein